MYIKVRITTGAKRESVVEKKEGVFEISVKEPAEENRANTRVLELLAEHLKVPKNKIRIINGHKRSHKLIEVFK